MVVCACSVACAAPSVAPTLAWQGEQSTPAADAPDSAPVMHAPSGVDGAEAAQALPDHALLGVAIWMAAAIVALLLLRARWFRRSAQVGPIWPLRGEASLLGFGCILLAAIVGGSVALGFGPTADDPSGALARQSMQSAGAALTQLAVIALLWSTPTMRMRGSAGAAGHGGVHRHPCSMAEALLMSLCVAVLLWPVTQALISGIMTVQVWFGEQAPPLGHETLRMLAEGADHGLWWWATIVAAVALAPLTEEWLYRGFLQQGLKSMGLGVRGAIFFSALLFALVHWGALPEGARLSGLPTLLLLGIAWGMLYERTGRLSAPVLAHALFNAANLVQAAWPQG